MSARASAPRGRIARRLASTAGGPVLATALVAAGSVMVLARLRGRLARTLLHERALTAEITASRDALCARLRQQAAVARLGRRSLEGISLQALFDEAAALVAASLEVETAKVMELLPGGASLRLVAGVGWKDGAVGQVLVDAGTESQAGYAILCKEPVICSDLQAETRFRVSPLLLEHGLRSGVCVVIHCRDEMYGVLSAHSVRRRDFTAYDVCFMQAMAHVLAQSIDLRRALDQARRHEQEHAAAAAAIHARDDVLGVVSHDLRSPLATIQMAAALAQRNIGCRSVIQELEIVQRAAAHMKRLIEDLLDVARIEAGRMSLGMAPFDARALLVETCDAVRAVATAKTIEVSCRFTGDLRVVADRDRILQVLTNLSGNALKFTPAGGKIVLIAEQVDHEVRVSVSDTGAGIPAEQIPRLFEPFWQARSADRSGVGLGLAIVRGIVEAHGGRVWAESEVGAGSTFHFTLRCDAEAEAAA